MELTGPWDVIMVPDRNGHQLIATTEHSGHGDIARYPRRAIAFQAALAGDSYTSDLVVCRLTAKPIVI